MKRDLLRFLGLIIVVAAGVYCFHVHEERHRFIVLGNAFGTPDVVVMFDQKTHKSCLVVLDPKMQRDDLCPR